jgi:cytochrome c-type biogenesis protein CcmH/NrfF
VTRRLRTLATLAAAAALAGSALPATTSAAVTPRTSLTAIWNEVMCVSCHEPLSVAQSPQAYAERAYIRALVAQGYTKTQIERALVAQYGPAVLGKPPAHGVNLLVYILPPAILAAGIAILAVTLPRWRRRTRAAAVRGPASNQRKLSAADERRLEEELSHYPG